MAAIVMVGRTYRRSRRARDARRDAERAERALDGRAGVLDAQARATPSG